MEDGGEYDRGSRFGGSPPFYWRGHQLMSIRAERAVKTAIGRTRSAQLSREATIEKNKNRTTEFVYAHAKGGEVYFFDFLIVFHVF